MIRIKEFSSYEEFSGMKEAWDDLIARSKVDNVFLTYDWMGSYIRNCCNGDRLIILTVFDDDALVGIAPLMIRRHGFKGLSVKSICFIGTTASDRMDFILDGPREKCVMSIMDYLIGIGRDWDFLDFHEIAGSSGTLEAIEKWAKLRDLKSVSGPWERSFFIKLNGNAEFILKKVSKKLNRKTKKLNKETRADLDFSRYMGNEAKESLFYEIRFIASRSWKGTGHKSVFLRHGIRDFHKDIFLEFANSGCLDISILRMGDTPIAYIYNFLYNGRLYNYSIEFDSRYSHISPGTMLMLWSIENAVSKGIKEIDFGRGEEGWKTRLTQDFRMQEKIRIFNNNFPGKGLYLLYLAVKGIKEHKGIYRILRNVKERFLCS